MTAPWSTMPTFSDGMNVDETEMDPLVDNINGLRDSARFLRGKWIQKAGNIVVGIGTAEYTPTEFNLDNVTVVSGQYYRFVYNIYGNFRISTGNSYEVRVRKSTAGSGATVLTTMWRSEVPFGLDDTKCFVLPWKATSSETTTYFLSLKRVNGSGLLDIRGDGLSACSIERAGDNAAAIWTTVT